MSMSSKKQTVEFQGNSLEFEYLEHGKAEKGSIVFLHGFPDTYHTFEKQIIHFSSSGYRCLAPALPGYLYKNQLPGKNYNLANVASALWAFLDAKKYSDLHLVGHDWGSTLSYIMTAQEPAKVKSLSLMAVPPLGELLKNAFQFPGQFLKSWYIAFFQLRGISDRIIEMTDLAFLEKLWRDWSPGWNIPGKEIQRMKSAFQAPLVLSSALAYYRGLFAVFTSEWQITRELAFQELNKPILAMTGQNDGCMDYRFFENFKGRYPGGIKCVTIRNAGHFLHLENDPVVNEQLSIFLRDVEN